MSNLVAVANHRDRLAAAGNHERAAQMAAYMKTDMPFFGVPAPQRRALEATLKKAVSVTSRETYTDLVLDLWGYEEREMKYAAIGMARAFKRWNDVPSMSLYRQLIQEGQWWDFVDEIAHHLVGACYQKHPEDIAPMMDEWVEDTNMWIRRTALISQSPRKEHTDAERLFRYCDALAAEKEFFIRKAIGWALRDYSYVAPQSVYDYLLSRRDTLSGLSFREGARVLVKRGWVFPEPT